MLKPRRAAVFIPTNLPTVDPRDISERAIARFKAGMSCARDLRAEMGRANVLVVLFGGWPLHARIPLAVHHAYAATELHKLLTPDELDLVASYGINTTTDLHGTLKWMKENVLDVQDAYVVTSKGHAERLVAESDMHSLFQKVNHIETGEPRYTKNEDKDWGVRAKSIPSHQYLIGGRASDVTRFGSIQSLEWMAKMKQWAEANPEQFSAYLNGLWDLVGKFEENNVVVRSRSPGCWRLEVNL